MTIIEFFFKVIKKKHESSKKVTKTKGSLYVS